MRKLLVLVAVLAMFVILPAAASAETGNESDSQHFQLLYSDLLPGSKNGAWFNEILDINWAGPRVTGGYSAEFLYLFPGSDNMRIGVGIGIRSTGVRAEPISFGDGGVLKRRGAMRWYSLIGEVEFRDRKMIRPFIGLTGSLLNAKREYETQYGSESDAYGKSDWGVGLEARGGVNLYPVKHLLLSAYLDYFDFATLPAVRVGAGFAF